MSKIVKFEGKTYSVPDDATMDEIDAVVSGSSQAASPSLLQSRQQASASEFESNRPESTLLSRSREAAIGVLEPFTAGSVLDTAKAGGNALLDAVTGKGTGKAQELVKGALMAPLEPIKDFASGVMSGDWDKAAYGAGGLLSKTAPAATVIPEVLSGVRTLARPALTSTAERLYESALKPGPRSNSLADVKGMVRTGLDERIPVSPGGTVKTGNLINDINARVESTINDRVPPINKFDVTRRLNDPAKTFSRQVNPEADMAALSDVGNEFLRTQPEQIPPTLAQELKKGTYRQLKDRAFGELKTSTKEGQKALARGLKEEIEARFPEIQGLNRRAGSLFKLQPELEAAVNRSANHNIMGIADPITAAGVGMATGSAPAGVAAGLTNRLFGRPAIKSRVAIALQRLAGR